MQADINKLYDIANKPSRNILGLMSGTSLDGLDIALCKVNHAGISTKVEIQHFATIPYENNLRNEIRKIFSKKEGSIELLTIMHSHLGKLHAQIINTTLSQWGVKKEEIDLIASHGQTLYHAPSRLHRQPSYGNATLQIGDADHISCGTGIITVSDFRMKHIAAGGEGAPLAVYGDFLLFSHDTENRILLNIGGISNFTYLPASHQVDAISFSTDVGPGNTLMDAYLQKNTSHLYDVNGDIAASGTVNEEVLSLLKSNDFFKASIPKTIGPELFNLAYLEAALVQSGSSLTLEDTVATLCKFTADTIAEAIINYTPSVDKKCIYISGGGVHNKTLLKNIATTLPHVPIKFVNDLGINGDAKEAVLFAVLANEAIAGNGYGSTFHFKNSPNVSFGKISLP
jgi:anhydro-N-acetylmuramic acid kinase